MKKTLFIIMLIVAIAAFVIPRANAQNEETDNGVITTSSSTNATAISSAATVLAAKFTKQINILNKVTISNDVFKNPAFQSLVDWKEAIPDEPKGRTNPFAPF